MTDTSGGSEEEEDEEFISDFEQSFYHENSDHLYLFIETLTGTSFEMRVSPFETILSIKAKLQQLEGIPVTQQHLLLNNTELANSLSLYECQVPDGATLKLVLSMRGGPINTRKIPLQDDGARELQEVMERSKEELLEHIPEGGHVTVLVFRDGDQINLYHVLERPDGSYSPLSDSLSGSSIRNLFAEDDPEIQERLKENANTMSKMQDIKTQMQDKRSKRRNSNFKRPKSSKKSNLNLPPLHKTDLKENETSSNELEFKNLTSMSQIHKSSNHFQTNKILNRREPLPRVKEKRNTLDISQNSPRLSNNNNINNSTYEHSNFPNRLKSSKKLISLDVSDLRSSEGVSPVLVSKSERVLNQNSDKFSESISSDRPRLTSPSPLELKLAEAEAKLRRGRSGRRNFTINENDQNMTSDKFRVPFLNLESEQKSVEGLMSHRSNINNDVMRASDLSAFTPAGPDSRGLDKRLVNSRGGRLKSISSPLRRTVLASPRLNSPRTPKSSAAKLRPSFQTRPLSGPKRKKTPRKRCAEAECRKKLNITNSFSCRCEKMFCPLHRHPESHSCAFDYKTEGRKILKAANPLVSIPKLPKI